MTAVAAAALVVVAGCSGGSSNGATGTGSKLTGGVGSGGVAADLPKPAYDTTKVDPTVPVKFAWAILPTSLDPKGARDFSAFSLLYDTLFTIQGNPAQLYPGIATKYQLSSDRLTVTMPLRTDAKFASGTTVDSAAVKASLQYLRDASGSQVNGALTNIASIDTPDATTVVLHLKAPGATLPFALATGSGIVIDPAALADPSKLASTTASSLPYKVTSFDPGVKLVLDRTSTTTYWDPNAFKPNHIEITVVADQTAVANGLLTGAFNLARLATPSSTKTQLAKSTTQYNYFSVSTLSNRFILVNPNRPGLQDPAIRTAIAQALDRSSIRNAIYPETCVDYSGYPIPKTSSFYDTAVLTDPLAYNVAAATSALANFKQTVTIVVALPDTVQVAQVVQQQLAKVGVKADIVTEQTNQARADFLAGKFDMTITGFAGSPDPIMGMQDVYGAQNPFPQQLQALTPLINDAESKPLGSAERKTAVTKALQESQKVGAVVPLCVTQQNFAATTNLAGLDQMGLNFASTYDLRYVAALKQ